MDLTLQLTDEEAAALQALAAWAAYDNPGDILRLAVRLITIDPIPARMWLLNLQDQVARNGAPGSYQQARGVTSGGEPAEVIQRRMRGG